MLIPNIIDRIQSIRTSAVFVLIVEKDATFQRLMDDRFTDKFSAILVTVIHVLILTQLFWYRAHILLNLKTTRAKESQILVQGN